MVGWRTLPDEQVANEVVSVAPLIVTVKGEEHVLAAGEGLGDVISAEPRQRYLARSVLT